MGNQRDAVNGVALHPYAALLFTSTGQRHFMQDAEDDEDEEGQRSRHDRINTQSGIQCFGFHRRARLEYDTTHANSNGS